MPKDPKPYIATIESLHLPTTPGRKIKQHTVLNGMPSGAVCLEETVSGTKLAARMISAQLQAI